MNHIMKQIKAKVSFPRKRQLIERARKDAFTVSLAKGSLDSYEWLDRLTMSVLIGYPFPLSRWERARERLFLVQQHAEVRTPHPCPLSHKGRGDLPSTMSQYVETPHAHS